MNNCIILLHVLIVSLSFIPEYVTLISPVLVFPPTRIWFSLTHCLCGTYVLQRLIWYGDCCVLIWTRDWVCCRPTRTNGSKRCEPSLLTEEIIKLPWIACFNLYNAVSFRVCQIETPRMREGCEIWQTLIYLTQ